MPTLQMRKKVNGREYNRCKTFLFYFKQRFCLCRVSENLGRELSKILYEKTFLG